MRISSSLVFNTGLNTIHAQQSDLLHLYQQIGSGQRMVTPADDPLAASQAIDIAQSQSLNQRYAANRSVANGNLGREEDALNSLTLLMQDMRTRVVEAANGTLSDADRATLADVLRNARETMLGVANTTDGNGQYLFSGSRGNVPAYSQEGLYQGDALQRNIQIDQTRKISSGDIGSDVFEHGGENLFSTIDALVDALETPIQGDDIAAQSLKDALTQASDHLETSYDNILSIRASIGSRMNELSALDGSGSQRDLGYTKALSDLEDLDYYDASMKLSLRQAALQGAAMAFQTIQGLSLFNMGAGR